MGDEKAEEGRERIRWQTRPKQSSHDQINLESSEPPLSLSVIMSHRLVCHLILRSLESPSAPFQFDVDVRVAKSGWPLSLRKTILLSLLRHSRRVDPKGGEGREVLWCSVSEKYFCRWVSLHRRKKFDILYFFKQYFFSCSRIELNYSSNWHVKPSVDPRRRRAAVRESEGEGEQCSFLGG